MIPKYFILAWCTGVCLSIMDAPKWPSISHYINKLNGEKCSPNRQQLVITIMLLSRHNKPWRQWRKTQAGDSFRLSHIYVSAVHNSLHLQCVLMRCPARYLIHSKINPFEMTNLQYFCTDYDCTNS